MQSVTQQYPMGQGMISNINARSDLNTDLLVLNSKLLPFYTYTNRGGFELLKVLKGKPNFVIQDFLHNEVYYTADTRIIRYRDDAVLFDGLNANSLHDAVTMCGKVYFSDGAKIYVLEGTTVSEAVYNPHKYLRADNGLSVPSIAPPNEKTLIVSSYAHGLNNNVTVSLINFTNTLGGQLINQSDLPITVIDDNSFKVTYPSAFTSTFSNNGGSGIIIAKFLSVPFPAGNIIETIGNRLYISGDPSNPRRIYQSNLVTPDNCDLVFEENTDDILNLGLSILETASQTYDLNRDQVGFITAIVKGPYGLHIFTDTSVWWSSGNFQDSGIRQVLVNDSIVNPRAYCVGDGIIYFKGTNHIYRTVGDRINFEPISTENEWYIKNADNSKVRMAFWDHSVICTLGNLNDMRNDSPTLPSAQVGDSELLNIKELNGLAWVFNTFLNKSHLWTGIIGNTFTVINTSNTVAGEIDYTRDLALWVDNSENAMTVYNSNGYKDLGASIPKMVITTFKYPGDPYTKKDFDKVIIYHENCVDLRCFYRIDDTDVALTFTEASKIEDESGNSMATFSLPSDKKGRGIQLVFITYNNSEQSKYLGYQIIFTT